MFARLKKNKDKTLNAKHLALKTLYNYLTYLSRQSVNDMLYYR